MDRHRFYADPETNPAFHFDADPDPTFHSDADPDPTLFYLSRHGVIVYRMVPY